MALVPQVMAETLSRFQFTRKEASFTELFGSGSRVSGVLDVSRCPFLSVNWAAGAETQDLPHPKSSNLCPGLCVGQGAAGPLMHLLHGRR